MREEFGYRDTSKHVLKGNSCYEEAKTERMMERTVQCFEYSVNLEKSIADFKLLPECFEGVLNRSQD